MKCDPRFYTSIFSLHLLLWCLLFVVFQGLLCLFWWGCAGFFSRVIVKIHDKEMYSKVKSCNFGSPDERDQVSEAEALWASFPTFPLREGRSSSLHDTAFFCPYITSEILSSDRKKPFYYGPVLSPSRP